ncbi:DUF1758 domain-containing protein [Trichonephila clavipes]|nr:DUF1758 domain-containing protein [Trichonephila clavipes]
MRYVVTLVQWRCSRLFSSVFSIPVCLVCAINKRLSLHPTGCIIVVAPTSDRGRHSELICDTSFIPPNNPDKKGTTSENVGVRGSSPRCDAPTKTISCCNVNTTHANIVLEVCRVLLVNESEEKEINLLLDKALQRCFFKKTVASEMKLHVKREENLLVYTFGSRTPIQKKYEVVEITLCNLSDPVNKIIIKALLMNVISGTSFRMSANKLKKSLSCKNIHKSNINESNGDEILVLIGPQYFWQIH